MIDGLHDDDDDDDELLLQQQQQQAQAQRPADKCYIGNYSFI